ncbi:MAG TPA: cytochrome P450 [Micromonosporaceae bacterium]|nr:cytochrome P450 [Micromonosporaceae bacterium]
MDAVAAYRALFTEEGRRNPFPLYATLHDHGPVLELGDRSPHLVVHGYDAVSRVLRDPAFHVPDMDRMSRTRPDWPEHPALVVFMNSMMFSNGARHVRTRRLVTQVFTMRRISSLAESITAVVDQLLDQMAEHGSGGSVVDFMTELAYPLPSNVIGALLGVPEEDRPWFRPHVIAIGGVLDGGSPQKLVDGDKAATELNNYFTDLIAQRRAKPQDDLISTLAQAWQEDSELTEAQLLSTLVLLFNAGFETTTHLLGNGLSVLLANPGSMDLLRDNPGRAASYVEEFLRMESPAQFTTRWATVDAKVDGFSVPAHGDVLVLFGAANHDPNRFPAPGMFDPARPDNNPLTFSTGPHFCPGAALARLEGEIAFSRLVTRFPGLTAAGPSTRLDQLALRGYTSVPIRIA